MKRHAAHDSLQKGQSDPTSKVNSRSKTQRQRIAPFTWLFDTFPSSQKGLLNSYSLPLAIKLEATPHNSSKEIR